MAKLTIREGGQSTVYEILDDAVSIGRKDGMAVRLKDPHVGTEHCQIRNVPGVGYKLIDLESRNGTKVNGKFVNQHVLANGDEIGLGEAVITFSGGAPAPAAAAPAAARPRPAAATARPAPARPAAARPAVARAPRETRDPREPRPRRSSTGSNAPIIALGVIVGLLLFGVAAVITIKPLFEGSKNHNIYLKMEELKDKERYEDALALAAQADPVSDPDAWKDVQKKKAEIERLVTGRDTNSSGDSAQRELWSIDKWFTKHRGDDAGFVAKLEAYILKHRGTVWQGHGQQRLDQFLSGTGFEGSAVGAGEPAVGTSEEEEEPDLDTGGSAKIDRAFRAALAASRAHADRDEFGPARDVIEDFWEKNALLAEDAEDWLDRKERAVGGIEDRAKARWERVSGLAEEYVKKGEYKKAIRLYEDVKKRFGLEKYETLARLAIGEISD